MILVNVYFQVAQVPRSLKVVIFVPMQQCQQPQTDHFTPCTCTWGINSVRNFARITAVTVVHTYIHCIFLYEE